MNNNLLHPPAVLPILFGSTREVFVRTKLAPWILPETMLAEISLLHQHLLDVTIEQVILPTIDILDKNHVR
jgi:hypothetical protein